MSQDMNHTAWNFPKPLSRLIERLPTLPPSFVLTRVLNLALREIIQRGDLQALHDKHIAIHVIDTGLHFYFTVRPDGFATIDFSATPDLAISATLQDFILLATRKEDPDTLFFNRRLVVEGDTELGLIAKNTLDGVDLPKLADFRPDRMLARFRENVLKSADA
jgi:predicted lipid carrier protein YhbT